MKAFLDICPFRSWPTQAANRAHSDFGAGPGHTARRRMPAHQTKGPGSPKHCRQKRGMLTQGLHHPFQPSHSCVILPTFRGFQVGDHFGCLAYLPAWLSGQKCRMKTCQWPRSLSPHSSAESLGSLFSALTSPGTQKLAVGSKRMQLYRLILWMDKIRSHHFEANAETMVCWYLPENRIIPGFLNGGARSGFRPSTVCEYLCVALGSTAFLSLQPSW